MTNKEKYKKAFSVICPPGEFILEVGKMKKIKKMKKPVDNHFHPCYYN